MLLDKIKKDVSHLRTMLRLLTDTMAYQYKEMQRMQRTIDMQSAEIFRLQNELKKCIKVEDHITITEHFDTGRWDMNEKRYITISKV